MISVDCFKGAKLRNEDAVNQIILSIQNLEY